MLTITVFLLVANYAWGEIANPLATGLNGTVPIADADLINNQIAQTGGGLAFFDTLIPFLIIGIFAFVMISAGAIIRSPIMIFVGVIILGVLVTVAVVYSNLYSHLLDSDLGSAGSNVTLGGLFMKYLPMVVIIGIILLVVAISFRGGGTGTL